MRDRLITLASALAALLLSIFLLAPPREQENKSISLPTTEDSRIHGLKGLYAWLKDNNISVYSLRKRFTDLENATDLAQQGNLLVLSMPPQREMLASEWQALSAWIDRGNTALVLGAAYSRVAWAGGNSCFCDIKKLLDGFGWTIESSRQTSQKETADDSETGQNSAGTSLKTRIDNIKSNLETFRPVEMALKPQAMLPLFHSVTALQSNITPASLEQYWLLSPESEKLLALRLLTLPERDNMTLMWQIKAGDGQIFLSLVADLFDNKTLNKADNARFFANLLAQSLSRKGRVIFDDYHFGLSELYDPERFFNDSRLHQTLGFIVLFWLLYVLGYSNRLAPVRIRPVRPSAKDFIDAMAGFFSRRLDKKTLAQELTIRLIQDIRSQRLLQDEQAAWQWLNLHPQIPGAQVRILLQAEQKQCTGLERLTNTITDIRKKIFL